MLSLGLGSVINLAQYDANICKNSHLKYMLRSEKYCLYSFKCHVSYFIFYCDTIILLSSLQPSDLKFCDANQLWSTTGISYFIVLVAVIFQYYYFM